MEPTVPSLHHDGDKEPKKVFPGGPDHLVNNKLIIFGKVLLATS